MKTKHWLSLSFFLLALGVLIGAFGAHGLKQVATPKALETFETGVRYHFYHAFGLLSLSLLSLMKPELKLSLSKWFLLAGIILFSFNCYLYAVTEIKAFALIVPLGGLSFVVGWMMAGFKLARSN